MSGRKSALISTVGELIAFLEGIPPETHVGIDGFSGDGWDSLDHCEARYKPPGEPYYEDGEPDEDNDANGAVVLS